MKEKERYAEGREKGLEWLLRHRNADGSFGPVEKGVFYYRLPWTLAVTGETEAAMGLVEWIRRNMFTPEGNFDGKYGRGDFESGWYPYPNANLIYGATILRQFDIAYKGMEFLLTLRDPESGGFYDAPGEVGPTGRQDLAVTSMVGLAALANGQKAMAEKIGKLLGRCWKMQPNIRERLLYQYSAEKGIITEYPEDMAKTYAVEAQQPRQYFFVPGLMAAFLARLYMATGKRGYLRLARKYEDWAMGCTERQFEVPQVCKTGWGSAILYQITKEKAYRDWTVRVADYYLETQQADGHWVNVEPYTQVHHDIEVTAEFVVHLDTIIGALAI